MTEREPNILTASLYGIGIGGHYTFDIQDRIGDISIPSLVITPENDMMIPLQISQSLADHLENSQFTLIPESGHMVILEQPARVAREIRAFLDLL
ncbi:MAG: hypothetical protein HXS44_00910 [Theionarchaea archaeon]|nr:hypothetical protein [Theionarchaea archaeon]